jgi:hypothetical protein
MKGREGSAREGGVRPAARSTAAPAGRAGERARRGAMMGWESAR